MGIRFIKYIRYIINCVLDVIYAKDEEGCVLCSNVASEGEDLCKVCKTDIRKCRDVYEVQHEGKIFTCYSAAYYCGAVQELILKLKYKSDFSCGSVLADIMCTTIKDSGQYMDVITYVPVSRKAYKKRGYNQCKFLAEKISKKLDIPVGNYLVKHKETQDQIGLTSKMRWNNLSKCFKSKENKKIFGKNILLIDDVVTTGATAFYCAEALISNGAKQVIILTAAKSRI